MLRDVQDCATSYLYNVIELAHFTYAIYSSAGTASSVRKLKKNIIYQSKVTANNGARDVTADSLGGKEDEKHNGVRFVEISIIFVTQSAIFFGMESFHEVTVT